MAFKPVVERVDIEWNGQNLVFYTRNASARQRAAWADLVKKGERTNVQNLEYIVSNYLVHEDGSPLTKDEANDVLDLDGLMVDDLVLAITKRLMKDPEKKS